MNKAKPFSYNGRQLEVRAVSGAHNTWIVSVLDQAGLTVSTTGSIPRWHEPDPADQPSGPHASVDSLMDQIIADVGNGRLPLLLP
jgi:hypothetical protein